VTGSGKRIGALFLIFLRLGLTSFGGPVAHLGYFRDEFVEHRRWLSDADYSGLVALCQFLPGPASSQVVIGIGFQQAGVPGAVAASLAFTLPSLLLMIGFGYGVLAFAAVDGADWIHALKVVAAAVVAQAIWAMARALCPDRLRASLALAGAATLLWFPGTTTQLLVIGLAGAIGWRLCAPVSVPSDGEAGAAGRLGPTSAALLLAAFAALLGVSILLSSPEGGPLALLGAMYQTGALVFGGGHVVLPLLEAETVRTGWVDRDTFLAGYGAAQALPGPLFTFAGFLGTVQSPSPNGLVGGLLATFAIFLPSFLLVLGVLPFWHRLRRSAPVGSALAGINAAVVGLLVAVFFDPILASAVQTGGDAALALIAFGLLAVWKWPPWLVVCGAGLGAAALQAMF
jgi:chromate transporter